MTDKEIVQEIAVMGKGIASITAKNCIDSKAYCDIDEFINMLLDQYKDAPIGLKKIIGGKLFNEIKFRYDRING